MEAAHHPWPALGVLLLRDGLVSKEELEEILAEQRDTRQQRVSGRSLGEILIQRGRVTPTQIARLVAEQYELPFVELEIADVDLRAAAVLSEDHARRFSALPVSRRPDGDYLLAIADPSTVLFSEELRTLLGSLPRFAVVGPDAIERAIDYVYSQHIEPYPPLVAEPADGLVLDFPTGGPVILPPDATVDGPVAQARPLLGALLVRDGSLTDGDLDAALAQQRLTPSYRLGEILVEKGLVTRSAVARLVAEQYELGFVDLDRVDLVPAVAALLDEDVAHRLMAVPIEQHPDGSLEVAIADPTSAVYSDELRRALDRPLSFVVASPDAIEDVLVRVHGRIDNGNDAPAPSDVEGFQDDPLPDAWLFEEAAEADSIFDEGGVVLAFEPELDVTTEQKHDEIEEPVVEELGWERRLELVDEVLAPEDDSSELEDSPVLHAEGWPLEIEEPGSTELEEVAEPAVEAVGLVEAPVEPGILVEDVDEIDASAQEPTDAQNAAFLTFPELPDLLGWEVDATVDEPDEPAAVLDEPVSADSPLDVGDAEAEAEDEAQDDRPFEPEVVVFSPVESPEPYVLDVAPLDVELSPASTDPEAHDVERDLAAIGSFEVPEPLDVEVTPVEVVLPPHVSEPEAHVVEPEPELAIPAGAAVLHFSPRSEGDLLVRARVDGLVRVLGSVSAAQRDELVRSLADDGLARVHTVVTPLGEKTTVFLAGREEPPLSLEELGAGTDLASLAALLERSSGAVLVCGPAGSGVSTTLHAALARASTPDRIVTTFEDTIERVLPDVDQVEVDLSHGETFAGAFRSMRFTDSDVVLAGALPDREAAELALQAADAGRLVLGGFRATGVVDAIRRLLDMGVPTHVLAASLSGLVAQRLVRTVCSECRETYYASEDELASLGQSEEGGPRLLARGRGCSECDGTGFRGRTAVFELLPVSVAVRELLADGASAKKLRRAAAASGMRTLRDEAARLCLEGLTTVAEVERVLGPGR